MMMRGKLKGEGEGVRDCLQRRQKPRPEEMEEKQVPAR